MRILGVTGWPQGGHDASACIVEKGKVIIVAEEERFTKKKHAIDVFPHQSMKYCLNFCGLTMRDIELVAFGWDLPQLYNSRGHSWKNEESEFLRALFPAEIFDYETLPKIQYINHHVAHAASSFYVSGFEKAGILVMDGQGENESCSLGIADRVNGIKIIKTIPPSASLGYFYKAATGHIGFHKDSAGKTMGLSSYGKPEHLCDYLLDNSGYRFPMLEGLDQKHINGELDEMQPIVDGWTEFFAKLPEYPDIMEYKDFAASVQHVMEDIGMHLVREILNTTKSSNLIIGGGVGLNCRMNGKIAKMSEVENLFIFPATHDSGTSVGAALEMSWQRGKLDYPNQIKSIHWGPSYSNEVIKEFLDDHRISYQFFNDDQLASQIGNLLYEGKVIGLFYGRSEIGPRALGGRSIIASPNTGEMRDRVNTIKNREQWRPLCPSVLEEYASEYFHHAQIGSYFMLRALEVKKKQVKNIAGVVHVDNTARVQLVKEDSFYGKCIKQYYRNSGIPMVLNTSFNLAGEPIVGSLKDAYKTFTNSGINVLILNNFLISKQE